MDGKIEWQNCYGGYGAEEAFDFQLTLDGKHIVFGMLTSTDNTGSGFHGVMDLWIPKINAKGDFYPWP